MLLILVLILLLFWGFGNFGSYPAFGPYRENGLIHAVLVIAVIVLVYWFLTGHRPL
jgi:hypothetical protein